MFVSSQALTAVSATSALHQTQADKENDPSISLVVSQLASSSLSSHATCTASLSPLHQQVMKIDCPQGSLPSFFVDGFISKLEDYTFSKNAFSASIEAFLSKNIPRLFSHNPQVTPTLIQAGGTKGVSGACVLVVRDIHNQVLAIVKGFLEREELIEELRSQAKLQQLQLKQSTFPTAFALGKCFADTCIYLMLQTVAMGEGIDDKILLIASYQQDSAQRKKAFDEAKQAVCHTAKALAELHVISITKRADEHGVQLMVQNLVSQLVELRKLKKDTSVSHFKDIVFDSLSEQQRSLVGLINDVIDEFKKDPGIGAIIHGDAHPGNFFYESQTQTLTLIDLPTMSRSFDTQGCGLRTPEWDVQLFAHKIADVVKIGKRLTPDEVQELKKTFKKSYRENTTCIQPTAAAKRFCKLNRILTTLVQRIKELKGYPKEDDLKRNVIELVIEDRKKVLQKMIQGYTPQIALLQTMPRKGPLPDIKTKFRKW